MREVERKIILFGFAFCAILKTASSRTVSTDIDPDFLPTPKGLVDVGHFEDDESPSEFLNRLMKGYDKRIRPYDKHTRLNVSINIYVSSFDSLQETSMDYRITFFLRMKWNDERLRFKELGSPLTMLTVSPEVLHNIWKPDIFFSNEKQANFHSITAENKLLRIDHEGDVYVSMRLSATLACHMRLERFPMDVQVCNIQIESFGYDMNDLYFTWSSLAAVELSNRIELPQFVLKGYRTANCMKIYDTGNFTCIEARFILARQMGYYMIECFIPSALIVILSWVSFWISIDAVPARVSLGITTVLTITSQRASISSSLPKVSYIKALDIWMVICIAYVFAAVLEYACANFISRQHKGILEQIHRKRVEWALFGHTAGATITDQLSACEPSSISKRTKSFTNMITEFPVTDAKPLTKFHTFFSSDPSVKNDGFPDPPFADYRENEDSDEKEIIKREFLRESLTPAMKFTKSVKHKFKNKLKHQTTKASLLDLEAMEGAEYYRKLAEWLDRASRVLFPLSFGTLSAFYWVYYLVIVNELRDATAKGGSEFVKYDQQTDDTRFTDPVLEKVGAIR